MSDQKLTTVLIGGVHDGQPIVCADTPMPTLVMLVDGGKSEGYTLQTHNHADESRAFYVLDGKAKNEARKLIEARWCQGLAHPNS